MKEERRQGQNNASIIRYGSCVDLYVLLTVLNIRFFLIGTFQYHIIDTDIKQHTGLLSLWPSSNTRT